MQLTPVSACALLLTGMVAAAYPPFPGAGPPPRPPGVKGLCGAKLAIMANASTVPASAVTCPSPNQRKKFCPTDLYCADLINGKVCLECDTPSAYPHGATDPCPPFGMTTPWKRWFGSPTDWKPFDSPYKCIPQQFNSSSSPKPGRKCDLSGLGGMDYGNYAAACHQYGGLTYDKNINLVWGPEYKCKDRAACLMHTQLIGCIPSPHCTASDIALVEAQETKTFCATMAPYNLSSCAVTYQLREHP